MRTFIYAKGGYDERGEKDPLFCLDQMEATEAELRAALRRYAEELTRLMD